jgi:hypothetical protein
MKFVLLLIFTTFGSREVNRDDSKEFATKDACQNYILSHQLTKGMVVSTHPPIYQMPGSCVAKAP